jgi:hypothetical protein
MRALVSALSLLAVGCSDGESGTPRNGPIFADLPTEKLTVELGNGFTYLAAGNIAVRAEDGFSIRNPLYISQSISNRYLIYSAVEESLDPEIHLLGPDGNNVRLTDNEFIEPLATVNDDGVYAYVVADHTTDESSLYLGDNLIGTSDPDRPIIRLEISGSYLAIGRQDSNADSSSVEFRNLTTNESESVVMPNGILEKLCFVDDATLAIQIFDTTHRTLLAYFYDTTTKELRPLGAMPSGDQHIRRGSGPSELLIDIVSGDDNARMLFNALHTWKTHHVANAYAYSNNFLGRLTWNSAYVLEGIIGLFRVTGHPLFALQVRNSVAAQLRVRNDSTLPGESTVPDFLWATRKYSLDRATPLTLFVDDARVLHPMLVATNEGLLAEPVAEEVLRVAERFLDHVEPQYLDVERLYRIKYGVNFHLDGVWGPYNWQSAVGLVLVELFKITRQQHLRERADRLARKFRSEWIENPDGSIVWSYWPSEFWSGWAISDGISLNTPSRAARTDSYFEDLSHAILNLKFVIEQQAQFGPTVFTESDLAGIQTTVPNFTFGSSFSRFMSGNTEFLPALYRNLPLYGWSQLDSTVLYPYYVSFIPEARPTIILAMTNRLRRADDNASLRISSYSYGPDQVPIPIETKDYSMSQLPEYFGLQ